MYVLVVLRGGPRHGPPRSCQLEYALPYCALLSRLCWPGDHLYACAKWPWCVRDDAPLPPGTAAQLPLLARWHDVTTTLRVAFDEPSLSAGEAVKEALVAVVPEEDRAKLRDGHFVLKVPLPLACGHAGRLYLRVPQGLWLSVARPRPAGNGLARVLQLSLNPALEVQLRVQLLAGPGGAR